MADDRFRPHFDPVRRRLTIVYAGFWTVPDAIEMQGRLAEALEAAGRHGPFTLLDDLRAWPTQSREVVAVIMGYADLVQAAPFRRNATVVPGALVRMQVGRTVGNLANCRLFDAIAPAAQWLAEVEPTD